MDDDDWWIGWSGWFVDFGKSVDDFSGELRVDKKKNRILDLDV